MPRTNNKISRKKAIETYLEGENPLAIISETIEEHTWTVGFNVEDASFYKERKSNPYDTCKNPRCKMCKKIKEQTERIPAYSLGKTLAKPFEELSLGHFGKLAAADVSKADMPKLLKVSMKEINAHIEKLVEAMGLDNAINLLKDYEISDSIVQKLLGIGAYDMRLHRQRMLGARKERIAESKKGEWS
ncbi:putative glycosyltransferase [Enterococcus phage vB_EfaS_TV16]|nr:putative glycosyltransferase [Enterococcus phage vB_EfaS_TV16]